MAVRFSGVFVWASVFIFGDFLLASSFALLFSVVVFVF